MKRRICPAILLLAGLALSFSGCVRVETRVHSNGVITKEIQVNVEAPRESVVRQEMARNLTPSNQGWIIVTRRYGHNSLVVATQSLSDVALAPNTSLEVESTGWVQRRYHYQERLPIGEYAASPSAKAVASAIPAVFSLRMPGKITEAPGATISRNVATWDLELGQEDVSIKATSVQNRYCTATLTVIAAFLVLATVVAWIREKITR